MEKMEREIRRSEEKQKEEMEYLKGENEQLKKRNMGLEMLEATYRDKVKLF